MTVDPAALRALAALVETGDALNEDVARALGWKLATDHQFNWWRHPLLGVPEKGLPKYLTDLTAAKSAMPEGWRINHLRQSDEDFAVSYWRDYAYVSAIALTEEAARVAAALRARAADLEVGDGE